MHLTFPFLLALALASAAAAADTAWLAGSSDAERFTCALALADGTTLIGGAADDLGWLPPEALVTELVAAGVPDATTADPRQKTFAIILRLAADAKTVLRVFHLPRGVGGCIAQLKTDAAPGGTGAIYVSGLWTNTTSPTASHYWLGKLDGDVVASVPTRVAWCWKDCENGAAAGRGDDAPAWDVGGDGRIVFSHYKDPAQGAWREICRLRPDGTALDSVPGWWENRASARTLSLKPGSGNLRSTTQPDYDLVTGDGTNGNGKKKGRWPYDFYYRSYRGSSTDGAGGYTGYSSDGKASTTVGIAVDRRTNDVYLGFNNGNPQNTHDFEPMVVAFTAEGALKWYSHLYTVWDDADGDSVVDAGETAQCPPDQYIDDLAIDYSRPASAPEIIVLARSHGNAARNFWNGGAYHRQFTGTNGNEHLGWIGRLRGDSGAFVSATWHCEYDPSSKNFGPPYTDPNLDGWPSHNEGWASLKTTKSQRTLTCDASGNVYVVSKGRGPVTTANAFQKSSNPSTGKKGAWMDFVRVYRADFSTLLYSSVLSVPWSDSDGSHGGEVNLCAVTPVVGGLLVVGWHTGVTTWGAMPTSDVPAWASSTPSGETAVLARLEFAGAGGTTGGRTTGGSTTDGGSTSPGSE
ncbi:MAG TPA: hypothetical protein VEL07_10735 [Planctomycetota bacterium]|nr:hypothetical protein [Planctomycetota bacterium]